MVAGGEGGGESRIEAGREGKAGMKWMEKEDCRWNGRGRGEGGGGKELGDGR